jgi:hypothetical protein
MNLEFEMQRRATELAERRARRGKKEDALGDFESDDDYHQNRGRRDYNYGDENWRARRDLPEAMFFRWEQDDLEIAHMEGRVTEANRALENALRDLEETKMRIRDRRREEKQQLNERNRMNHGVPEFARPFVDDVHERVDFLSPGDITSDADLFFDKASQQPIRDYLSPAGNKSRPSTPQQSSSSLPARSRSPSPYRFTSRTESEIPRLPSQSVHKTRSRSRTPNPGNEMGSASQEQVYESFRKIHDLAKEFQTLKQNFVYPSVIDFEKPGSQAGEIITVRARSPPPEDESMSDGAVDSEEEGKLAYTRTNEGLHTYSYAMEKLLGRLDSVDSWNEKSVRSQRRGVISQIEQEASKLEQFRQKVWRTLKD